MTLRPDLIASRYAGLSTGKTLMYSFDTQDAIPVDATSAMARNLSPFTLRLVLPDIYQTVALGVPAGSVNTISRGGAEIQTLNTYADGVQQQYGLLTVTKSNAGTAPKGVPSTTQQAYAAGKALIQANGVNQRMAVLSDENTARDIKYQIEKIQKAPPLTLLVNPNNMSTSYATVQKFSDKTRFGYLFERFGEEQVKITFSGSTGAFIAGENSRAAGSSIGESTTPTGQGPISQSEQLPLTMTSSPISGISRVSVTGSRLRLLTAWIGTWNLSRVECMTERVRSPMSVPCERPIRTP